MSKTITILLLLIIFNTTVQADLGLDFDRNGTFVPPELIYQYRGIKSYQDGRIAQAISELKRSARFGNDYSKYLIASLYFEQKKWVDGYAWLQLLTQPIHKSETLDQQVKAGLSEKQMSQSQKKLADLQKNYSEEASFKRRQKWERSLTAVGTNLKGIDAMLRKNVRLTVPGSAATPEQPWFEKPSKTTSKMAIKMIQQRIKMDNTISLFTA